jgi:hypothetical protein
LTAVMGNVRITSAKPCVLTVVMGNVRHRAVQAARLSGLMSTRRSLRLRCWLASVGLLSASGYRQDHHRLTDKEVSRGV